MAGSRVRAPRYEVRLEVVCDTGSGVFSGPVIDMSESGVFMRTDQVLRVGTTVTLTPNVGDEVKLPSEIKAQVVRVGLLNLGPGAGSVQGIAFRLVGLTVVHFAEVRAFLARFGRRRQLPLGKPAPKKP